MGRQILSRRYLCTLYSRGTKGRERETKKEKAKDRERSWGDEASRVKSRGENLRSQNSPVGSFADYPRVTDRTARGQSKQVVSLHFAQGGEERREKERGRERKEKKERKTERDGERGREGEREEREKEWPWAIARRFDHKTRSYGYLKTYWPAHAPMHGSRVDGAVARAQEGRRDPAEINQRILRSFLPLRSLACICARKGEGGAFLAECITGRQRAVIKLSVIPCACTCLLYVPIGDKRPGAIHRIRPAKWILDKRILSLAAKPSAHRNAYSNPTRGPHARKRSLLRADL